MHRALAHALIAAALASPLAAVAEEPTALVRGYFAALEKKDFGRAIALTKGAALRQTEHMVGTLHDEAARHHADVELQVKKLQVTPDDGHHVKVDFSIDVVGKKWCFKKVARKLCGTAEFKVAESGDRIEAIEGALQ